MHLEVEKLQEAKVILSDPNTAPRYLPSLLELEWMQLTWAGVEEAIKYVTPQQKGSLTLTRFGGVFGPAMVQYVIGHIVSWEREFRKLWRDQQECKWDKEWALNAKYCVMPKLTIGILGLGDIGQNLAKTCKALNMTVWGVGRRDKSDRQEFVDHYATLSRLPEVLQSCDYVCNILPSTTATKYLLSGNVLESGKDKRPVFINIGRGDVIDEKSLIHALNEGWISGAILDVFEVEPLPKESALWKMPQVVITPHTAAVSFPEEVAELFAENLALYEAGEKLKFCVDVDQGY